MKLRPAPVRFVSGFWWAYTKAGARLSLAWWYAWQCARLGIEDAWP